MGQALAILPDKQQMLDVKKRIAVMLPGGSKLNDNEQYALAQLSLMHSLDPFNGEIWYIPNRGPMIGIKGLRKKAREQVKGNFWINFREITDADERKRYGIADRALAFEARLFDSENVRTYCAMIETMTKSGIPWSDVKGMIGEQPYTSGIGVLKPEDQTKMERVQCAMKRAEADALKRRFDVPFGMTINAEIDYEDHAQDWVIEGQLVDTQDADPRKAFDAKCIELKATEAEISLAMDDAGGDYETAAQYLSRRVSARVLTNGKKQMGRDDSGL
ncbi:MAG: hypothetical protein IPO08_20260 [Xanthomonadales bacterium]|nr:hypothetical protein [Xanthomonadales bacterium]